MKKNQFRKKHGFIIATKTSEGYRYGYINYLGKKTLDTEYNEIVRLQDNLLKDDIYLVAIKKGQVGFIKNKKLILKHEYEDIQYDNVNKLLILQRNAKQGVSTLEGEIKIPIEYDNILIAGNCINAQKSEDITLFHPDGTKFNNTNYISMFPIENGKYTICIDREDNYGVLDEQNNQVIENKYTFINYLWNNYFIAQNDKKLGVISVEGNIIIDFKYDVLQKIDESKIIEGIIDNQTYLIDENLNIITNLEHASLKIKKDYIEAYSALDNKIVYIDIYGNLVDNKEILKENKLFTKEQNGKWGFTDKYGNFKVEPKFDMVTDFNEYGFAGIKLNNKWGTINEEGEIVQEPKYELEAEIVPNFIGKYYEVSLGYGEIFYKSE